VCEESSRLLIESHPAIVPVSGTGQVAAPGVDADPHIPISADLIHEPRDVAGVVAADVAGHGAVAGTRRDAVPISTPQVQSPAVAVSDLDVAGVAVVELPAPYEAVTFMKMISIGSSRKGKQTDSCRRKELLHWIILLSNPNGALH